MKISRKLLSLLLCAALIFTALPVVVSATDGEPREADAPFLLATVSDIHYYPTSLAKYKGEAFYTYFKGANCVYDNLNGVLDAAFDSLAADVAEKGLKYVVVCGDLTTNGEYEGHAELAEKFRAFEEATGAEVFVINGNHDINNSLASDFSYPDGLRHDAKITTPADFYNIYRAFGFDDADSAFSAFDTGKAGALSYSVVRDGYRLIMIDAGKYSADHTAKGKDEHETGGHITPELYAWIEAQVGAAKDNGETPLLFTHWNASEMNYMHGEVLQGFVIDDAYRLQESLADMGVHYIFSGHQHVADTDVTYSDAGEPLYSVITPSLTQFPCAYRETAFTRGEDGSISADLRLIDCDATKLVESDKGDIYMRPYSESCFYLQLGEGSAENYLTGIVKGMLSGYITKLQKAGSVVAFMKNEFGLDVEKEIDNLIHGGFSIEDIDLFTTANVMSFIRDLDDQIMRTYIDNPARLWDALGNVIRNLVNLKVSDVPCTKFINTYGFGDAKKPGTLGDVLFSAMAYMYSGNEDSSDDKFMQDVVKQADKPAFVDMIFNAAERYIVEEFLVDEILANLYVHVNKLFDASMIYVPGFLQVVYRIFAGGTKENIFTSTSAADFAKKLINFMYLVVADDSAITYKYLLEYVLGTGVVKYGNTVKDLVNGLLAQYFPLANKEATAHQINVILDGCINDDDADWNVVYAYDGPVEVTPTRGDMQLPSDITLRLEDDTLLLRWITKYSVTGGDIEIAEKQTGAAIGADAVQTQTVQDTYSGFGFSFGSFGILPWTRDVNVHTATVTGLEPGKTYVYRVGDAAKGFWSPQAEFTVPEATENSFSFVYVTDYGAGTPAGCGQFGSLLKTAVDNCADMRFVLLGGPSALNGEDDTQFSGVINAAAETLSRVSARYVSGKNDLAETPNIIKHYNPPKADQYNNDLLGTYYSFNEGNAHFAVVNTNDLGADGRLKPVQVQWLEEDMTASHAKWKIVALDAPVLTGANDNDALAAQITELCNKLKVDLLLQDGAKAVYRSHLIVNGEYNEKADTMIRTLNGRTYRSLVGDGFVSFAPGTSGRYYEAAAADEAKYKAAQTQNAPVYTQISVFENDIAVLVYEVDAAGKRTVAEAFALTKIGTKAKLGDIDGDGEITSSDARLALRCAVKLEELKPAQRLVADVDFSRSVTAADARAILRAAVSLEQIVPETIEYYRHDLEEVDF